VQNFAGFPTVADYLDSVWIFPRRELANLPLGQNWIKFESSGAVSAPSWILGAVVDRILAKIADYEHRSLHALLADLILRYSRCVGRALANEHGIFNGIFLFNPYEAQKVLQVYPSRLAKQHQRTI
jgi:hypothetical protein